MLCGRQMTDLMPEQLFADPIRPALSTAHRHLALGDALAGRYPADVAPFATLAEPGETAMERLRALLTPGEAVWLFGDAYSSVPGMEIAGQMTLFQMGLPMDIVPPEPSAELVALGAAEAHEMVGLTDIAFPGFFRSGTYRMGSYCGVRAPDGTLIAMGGERLKLHDYAEVSGVCTHPDFRGRGHAESIIWQVVHLQRRAGLRSFLHVTKGNDRAISLYEKMGFEICREVRITQVKAA